MTLWRPFLRFRYRYRYNCAHGKLGVIFHYSSWVALCVAVLFPLGVQAREAGFLDHEFPLTMSDGHRREILGPLFSTQERQTDRGWAVSPLMSYRKDTARDLEEFDLIYPVLTYARYGHEYRWQLMQLFAISGGNDQEDQTTKRTTIFPIFFKSKSPDPSRNYLAVLPFYGTIKNRLMRDKIEFIAFPIYLKSWKKDVVTRNFVFPIFHLREGNNLHGWQVFPLVGAETKGVTSVTNRFGGVEKVPDHHKSFVLWPIYATFDQAVGTTNQVKNRLVLPFYSSVRTPERDSTSFLLPFGPTFTNNKEKNYREYDFPWPFIGYARGEGKTMNRIFPLFSFAHTPTASSDFVAWPIYKKNAFKTELVERERTRWMLFFYSDVIQKSLATGKTFRRRDFWPFYTWRQEMDGRSRLQVLAVVEPFVPENRRVERVYSPVYAFWRAERNPVTGHSSESLLWNLYRSDEKPGARKVSMLFGLIRYERSPEGKSCKVFGVPTGR